MKRTILMTFHWERTNVLTKRKVLSIENLFDGERAIGKSFFFCLKELQNIRGNQNLSKKIT